MPRRSPAAGTPHQRSPGPSGHRTPFPTGSRRRPQPCRRSGAGRLTSGGEPAGKQPYLQEGYGEGPVWKSSTGKSCITCTSFVEPLPTAYVNYGSAPPLAQRQTKKKLKKSSPGEKILCKHLSERQLSLKGLQVFFCLVFPINEKENTAGWMENSGQLHVGSSCQLSDGKGGPVCVQAGALISNLQDAIACTVNWPMAPSQMEGAS